MKIVSADETKAAEASGRTIAGGGKLFTPDSITGTLYMPQSGLPDDIGGEWSGVFDWPMIGLHATLTPDGKILTFGTDQLGTQGSGTLIYDVWDPTTNTHYTLPNQTPTNMFCCAAIVVPSTGKILITGGDASTMNRSKMGVHDVNVFDYRDMSISVSLDGPMSYERWYPTVVGLANGKVLVLGGKNLAGNGVGMPELYTPGDGWKSLTGAYSSAIATDWQYPRAWLAPSGKVFLFEANSTANDRADVMVMDPSGNGTLTKVADLPFTTGWQFPAVKFAPDKVLILDDRGGAWVMDMSGDVPTFQKTGSLGEVRCWSNLVVLADGSVMVSGGSNVANQLVAVHNQVEIWNPQTGVWTTADEAAVARLYHSTAILLPDATVLSLGGGGPGPLTNTSGEIYKPGYLFNADGSLAARPVITDAPQSIEQQQSFTITLDDAANITRLTFIKTGSVTHSMDMSTGMLDLSFTHGPGNTLVVTVPNNANVLAPGNWMLFAFNDQGTPSVAATISIGLGGENFSPSVNGYVTVSGAASYDTAADAFTLTPGAPGKFGAVMSNDRIDMTQDFILTFSAFLGSQNSGGDGIAFVLHNDSLGGDAFGGAPSAQGALGIANGLAISIDTYSNPGDPLADHTNFLDTDGAQLGTANAAASANLTPAISLSDLENSQWHNVTVFWDAGTQILTYSIDGQDGGTITGDLANQYFGGSNYVYFGFTGATGAGAASNLQQVKVTSVTATYAPADTLHGGAGADTMLGGTGNDIYVVDNAGDVVDETDGNGIDLVRASISFSLADAARAIGGIENLTLLGTGAINATGNDLANVLTGNSSNNILTGLGGNDTLNGGAGADTMLGGTGNDIYLVDNAGDVVNETGGDGTDTVQAWIAFSLADTARAIGGIENLTLLGTGAINATGNDLANVLTGNFANNILTGLGGADMLDGGSGVDTASYAASASGVTVSLMTGTGSGGDAQGDTLTNIENLTGSSSDDTLEGNAGNNVLAGGLGTDTVSYAHAASGAGGKGVTVNLAIAMAQNTVTAGTDTLSGFENVTGSEFNDTLVGTATANVLTGLGGNDTLNGGAGADTMLGGTGNDTYVVDNAGDVVNETGGDGTDTVQAWIAFSLADTARAIGGIENLTLLGTGAINATGNDLANVLTGNFANNILTGLGGADMLDGGSGVDTASYAASASGVTVSLMTGTGSGGDAQGDTLTNIENLTGSSSDDTLEGNAGNNVLAGGLGTDTVSYAHAASGAGGKGVTVNLAIAMAQNTVTAGTDTLSGFENVTGSEFNDTLVGTATANVLTGLGGNDTLNGGAGADTMLGGTGNDIYLVDNAGDVVDETGGDGTDTVQASIAFSLADAARAIGGIENLTLLGTGAINATGNDLANVLTGNSSINILTGLGGNDTLNGGAGADTMLGGTGNDTYVVDNAGDVVNETGGDGTDTVQAWIAFSLADTARAIGGIENLTLLGTGAINATGNDLANVLTGNFANNILTGLGGADMLDGGSGVDTASYAASASGVTVSLMTGTGSGGDAQGDTLTNIENLTGSSSDDTLEGNAGNNVLAGGLGTDTVSYAHAASGAGGKGVTVNLAIAMAQNTVTAGTDTLSGFENVTGSEFNDTLVGTATANVLTGLGGNDTLNGGAGADTMLGGTGNDIYLVDNAGDVVDETGGDGTDTVQASIAFSLADAARAIGGIENLTLLGTGAINATGNDLANVLTGNSSINILTGLGGNDTLNGGAGADTMLGGTGNDTYVVDNAGDVVNETGGDGTDTVQAWIAFSLADTARAIGGIENLTLLGTGAINATGNDLANVLTGNFANNILTGLGGADMLDGGSGVDTASYAASASGVTVSLMTGTGSGGDAQGDTLTNIENLTGSSSDDTLEGNAGNNVLAGGLGTDTVSYAHAASGAGGKGVTVNLAIAMAQNTVTAGTDTLSGFENVTGSEFNDTLVGTATANVLTGLGGNDTLNGGAGADTMLGGTGNDIYLVDNAGDVVDETGGDGTDTVQASIAFSLADAARAIGGIENLTLLGTGAINATGNDLANVLTGNSSINILTGLGGNDTLNGGAGADTMLGGTGNDTYVVDNAGDVVNETGGDGTDTVQAWIAFSLADTARAIGGIENLTLLGTGAINATGNDLANVLTGNFANNILTGLGGADMLDGGSGVDTASYAASASGVTVSLMTGTGSGGDAQGDTLTNIENLTGSSSDDTLEGNAGNNVLAGGLGTDTVSYAHAASGAGGKGVTVNLAIAMAQNTVTAGTDTLSGFENVTGSEFNDTLVGTATANVLTGLGGNDTLNGGAGADTMLGGTGNDIYLVDNAGDVVDETGGDGTDTVQASIAFSLADAARAIGGIENLTLLGTGAINATGNDLANVLTGNSSINILTGLGGNDTLNGGAGADTMLGGTGNDTYVVDNAGDVVNETGGDGTDTVQAWIAFSLADTARAIGGIENLTLLGTGAINATGNDLANVLTGNFANNILTGLGGADMLDGGSGVDTASYAASASGVTVSLMTGTGSGGDAQGDTLTNIENLTGSSSDDTLEGNAGNNVLAGGLGTDTVSYAHAASGAGGKGVTVNLAIAMAQNTVTAGTDTLSGFENVTGSEFNDTLVGTATANVLTGLGGNDTLNGGAGADTFVYHSPTEGGDTIRGFIVQDDTIQISASGFGGGLVAGHHLVAGVNFIADAHPTATSEAGTFLFNAETHDLAWDPDGLGEAAAVQIADFDTPVDLTVHHFEITA